MQSADNPNQFAMSFGDHLDELRKRVILSLIVPLPLCVLTFVFSNPLIELLFRPLDSVLDDNGLPRRLQSLGPAEVLGVQIKLSLILALVLSAPWIVYQAWKFIQPGLYHHERRFVRFLVPGSSILTITGLALMYFIMLPLMLKVLVLFGSALATGGQETIDPRVEQVLAGEPDIKLRSADPETPFPGDAWLRWPTMDLVVAVPPIDAQAQVPDLIVMRQDGGALVSQEFRLTTYVNFVLLLMLAIMVAFQLPLVILLLGWMGILTAAELRRKRRHALLICAIAAAVITPADALSMIMMLIPLYGLFELSIIMLVVAPASAVAEGNVWSRWRRRSESDNEPAQTDQLDENE